MADLAATLGTLLQGLRLVGDASTQLLLLLFEHSGLQVPPLAIQLSTILFLVLLVWKFSGALSKLALLILVFLLLSTSAGLVGSLTGLIPGV